MIPTQAGIAFAWLSLDNDSKLKVQETWKKFPLGRYLLPFEMGKIVRKEIRQTLKPEQEDAMMETWNEWSKATDFPQDTLPREPEVWFRWLTYAETHYHEPLPAVAASDWHD